MTAAPPAAAAGHDTSSATLTVLLWYLGQSPRALAALAAEQARLQAQHGPEISWEVLEGMEYARWAGRAGEAEAEAEQAGLPCCIR
jgi:cytochrome P450